MRRLISVGAVAAIMSFGMGAAASAQERLIDGALGAGAGALVGGPVGAVAGGAIGYGAGPHIARGLGVRGRHHYRRHYRHRRHHRHYR